ncbi:hypothetical protein Tco_1118807 [Tanacetum coccineum]
MKKKVNSEYVMDNVLKSVGIKSFIRLFRITAALIKVSAAQEERVNAVGTKLQLLTELQLLMDKDCSKKDKDCLCDMYEIFL